MGCGRRNRTPGLIRTGYEEDGARDIRLGGTNGNNVSQVAVTAGGQLIAHNSTFGWDNLPLAHARTEEPFDVGDHQVAMRAL